MTYGYDEPEHHTPLDQLHAHMAEGDYLVAIPGHVLFFNLPAPAMRVAYHGHPQARIELAFGAITQLHAQAATT